MRSITANFVGILQDLTLEREVLKDALKEAVDAGGESSPPNLFILKDSK